MTELFLSSQSSIHPNSNHNNSNNNINNNNNNNNNGIHQNCSPTFTASTNQISHLADVFSTITSINSQALMIIKPSGITVYAEYNHICNVQLTIDPSLFLIYNFYSKDENGEQVSQGDQSSCLRLGVDIGLIGESFNSASSSTPSNKKNTGLSVTGNSTNNTSSDNVTCYITYNGEGNPLIIEFEDSLMSEKIEFLTFYVDIIYPYDSQQQKDDDDENYNLILDHNEIQFELILKSDVFTNLLQDLQQINTADLFIYISNELKTLGTKYPQRLQKNNKRKGPIFVDNQLNFISKGPIGHSKLIYPNEKTILEKLLIYGKVNENEEYSEMKLINTSLISCYNFSTFIKIFKAVKLSSKCKILKDLNGILSIQLLCKNSKLINYSGTLITFNMLEISTITDDFENNNSNFNNIHLNNIFDDESYEYIKDYSSKNLTDTSTNGLDRPPRNNEDKTLAEEINNENIINHTTSGIAEKEVQEISNRKPLQPQLSYASFRQTSNSNTTNNFQVNETIYESEEVSKEMSKKNAKKRKKNNDNDDNRTNTVGGAIDVPLFL